MNSNVPRVSFFVLLSLLFFSQHFFAEHGTLRVHSSEEKAMDQMLKDEPKLKCSGTKKDGTCSVFKKKEISEVPECPYAKSKKKKTVSITKKKKSFISKRPRERQQIDLRPLELLQEPGYDESIETSKKYKFKFSGYVRMDGFFDTRQNLDFWRGFDLAHPARVLLDPNGQDVNAKAQYNMVPYTALRLKATGPKCFNARSSATVRTDFAGKVDTAGEQHFGSLRLQHGYVQFDWEKTKLIGGLAYHPLTILRFSTDTIAINAGEMFDPFQYSAHLMYQHKLEFFEFIFALGKLYERERSRDAIMPDFFAEVVAEYKEHLFAMGVDVRAIVPRLQTETDPIFATLLEGREVEHGYKTSQMIVSPIAFVGAKLQWGNVTSTTRFTYAANAAPFSLIGGYAVKCRDPQTDKRQYTLLRSLNFWTDLSYNNDVFEIGVLVGTAKNIGSKYKILREPIADDAPEGTQGDLLAFGFALDMDYLVRIQPRLRVFSGPVTFGAEVEYTRAAFGTTNECGRVCNACPVANTRLLGSIIYSW
ncbi:hypothetical protein KAH94_04095 [bacterium]|nr:hypothetical protein [bacterium]